MEYLSRHIETCAIIDPANSNNNIAIGLTTVEKSQIKRAAELALTQDHGNTVSMNKILW